MSDSLELDATLKLRGHEPTPASVEVEEISSRGRAVSAAIVMLSAMVAAPVLFVIPPHLPWGLGALALGAFLAWRQWSGRYPVRGFRGTCPRCGSALAIEPGTKITLPHRVTCYECHHESDLRVPELD